MGNRLRALREKAGWTHEQAAEAMGVSRSQFIKLERGERRLTADYIAAAARAFNVEQSEVITEKATVPLVGYVGAGALAHFYSDGHGNLDEVPMPEGGNDNTVAVEARGDSLGSFFNQWLVYYDEVRTPPTTDMIGKLCVVGLIDGRVLVKKLMRGSQPGHFHLLSQTESPIEDQEILWAAKVTAMTPR
jgi:transcriptional regulator with XRE-family HTH domain